MLAVRMTRRDTLIDYPRQWECMPTPLRAVGLAALAAQIVPAATWLPAVRRLTPGLAGEGAADHVALTFDDGPHAESTPAFLDVLARRGARATFFLVGSRVRVAPELVRRIAAEGHEIGVHGWSHRYSLWAPMRLGECVAAVRAVTAESDDAGVTPLWFRPPYGVLSASALWAARQAGLRPVLWTAWAKDWRADADAGGVARRALEGIRGGATLLLHDAPDAGKPASVSKSWRATLGALPAILDRCTELGLRVGPLREHFEPSRL